MPTTTTIDAPVAFSIAASRALGERLGDSPTTAALRAEAAAVSTVKAWPDSYAERPWKYYPLGRFALDGYAPALPESRQVEVSGGAQAGVTVSTFEAAKDAKQRDLIDRRLGSAVQPTANRFAAYHYAFLSGGVLVDIAANEEPKQPLRITRNFSTAKQFAAPHTLIVTGANSRIDVIEDYRSSDEDMLIFPAVEVLPGPGSTVRYTAIHRWGANTRVFGEQRMVPERDSAFVGLSVVTGGSVVKSHIESSLTARGSSSELYALAMGTDAQHIDFYTVQDHIGPDTRSDLLFKAALTGHSRAAYYGLTRVGVGAKNADANQQNRNLLLSDTAKADSDPVLEILTSDIIRCSHGATAGPVDQEQLYYLQTRGLRHHEAEALLVRAFLGQVLDRVPDEALRDELAAVLDAKLG